MNLARASKQRADIESAPTAARQVPPLTHVGARLAGKTMPAIRQSRPARAVPTTPYLPATHPYYNKVDKNLPPVGFDANQREIGLYLDAVREPPLCKGRWQRVSADGGIVTLRGRPTYNADGTIPHRFAEPFGPGPLCRFATSPRTAGSHPLHKGAIR